MIPTWTIVAPLTAIGAGYLVLCWLGRRSDRKWAAETARRVRQREADEVHDSRYLEWLEEQFASEGRTQ